MSVCVCVRVCASLELLWRVAIDDVWVSPVPVYAHRRLQGHAIPKRGHEAIDDLRPV